MPDLYEFTDIEQDVSAYQDGTIIPHLGAKLRLNGVLVGYIDVHCHRVTNPRGVSYGFTGRVFEPGLDAAIPDSRGGSV